MLEYRFRNKLHYSGTGLAVHFKICYRTILENYVSYTFGSFDVSISARFEDEWE